MTEENPYATPETDPIQPAVVGESQLATLYDRFFGAFIDGLIGTGIAFALWRIAIAIGVLGSFSEVGNKGVLFTVIISVIQFVVYMAIQWSNIAATGQTIGKKVAKTRMVTMAGNKPDAKDVVLKRYGFVTLISNIPVAGAFLALADILLIFRKDRRCLHDIVAGTRVIKVQPGEIIS